MRLPEITEKGLARELAEMIQEAAPENRKSKITLRFSGNSRAETERQGQTIKHRVIEVRDAKQPGRAFIQGISYWPAGAPTAKE